MDDGRAEANSGAGADGVRAGRLQAHEGRRRDLVLPHAPGQGQASGRDLPDSGFIEKRDDAQDSARASNGVGTVCLGRSRRIGTTAETSPHSSASDEQPRATESKKKRKGHGRNGADDYTGARQIRVSLESMKPGDRCPCGKGNLYEIDDSALVRIVGQAPLHADVYRLERLRCNTCGDVFTAKAPDGVGSEKYDATSTAMVALMKYGSGFPFHRLEQLEDNRRDAARGGAHWSSRTDDI